MSMSPQQIFGRLHELKKWQETHEKLLKRSSFDENHQDKSENLNDTMNSVKNSKITSPEEDNNNWRRDQSTSYFDENFEELLEKQLNEFAEKFPTTENVEDKPKKPFLRKGTGLLKYNLKPDEYKKMIGSKYSNPIIPRKELPKTAGGFSTKSLGMSIRPKTTTAMNKSKPRNRRLINSNKKSPVKNSQQVKPSLCAKNNNSVEISVKNNKKVEEKCFRNVEAKPSSAPKRNSPTLHDFLESISKERTEELTPLKAPELVIRPKGNWSNTGKYESNTNHQLDNFKKNVNIINQQVIVQSKWTNSILNNNKPSMEIPGKDIETRGEEIGARKSLSYESSDQSLYEKALETELRIFEALEKRVEQSGFCSTNTSIIQLLSSTPSKFNMKRQQVFEKIIDTGEDIDNHPVKDDNNMLQNINVLKMENRQCKNQLTNSFSTSECSEVTPTNYSGETSELSDVGEEEYEEEEVAETFTSDTNIIPERNQTEDCSYCGAFIRDKIEECQIELNHLKEEKERIVSLRERMQKDKTDFEEEMTEKRREFEEEKRKMQEEIEVKRKMLEKQSVERLSKPKSSHKRDREEINNLKMELNETKELMKLRETKNAMSLARLRSQVKVLEKTNAELKTENEKLVKEKSKLIAQQKTQSKTSETKMLKEISKNISKLTEETFKNHHYKLETSSEDDVNRSKSIRNCCKGDSVKSAPEIAKKKSVNFSRNASGDEGSTLVDKRENIEERYKSLFGGNDAIIEEIPEPTPQTIGLSKCETILEDRTKEIKYSNGNVKTISENGKNLTEINDTWHTNFPDGSEVIEFPNGQSEKRFKDGKCVVFFPDGLVQTIFPDGTEEVQYPDGSKLLTRKDGNRMLFLANGQVEIHTKDQKRREYPDGTVKILYPDGSQETRYSNGRVRMKNSKGDVILDTGETSN